MKVTKRILRVRNQLNTTKDVKTRLALEARIELLESKRKAKYGK